ncbi:carbon-nitrogen hydrolase family protein [Sporobolomyces koalae]|uniref:carbon-nitrogen hydrolase family protein n=1 Tax=Sporobolomyces koalae TaxID=500713 RepID=UPI003177FD57
MPLAAVGQLCSNVSVSRNSKIACDLIRQAGAKGVQILFLPEATDFIAPADQVKHLSQSIDQPGGFVEIIRKQARDSNVWLNLGIHEKGPAEGEDSGRCYNTNLLIDDRGEIVSSYRKLHLFDVAITGGTHILESRTTIRGARPVPPAPTPVGTLGLMTCYDLRFPELSLSLRRQGAQLLCYPSAFTVKTGKLYVFRSRIRLSSRLTCFMKIHAGKAHWETLLKARAIESQCYVFAAAQFGTHAPGRESFGHSLIVGPFGDVLAAIDTPQDSLDEGILATAEVDLSALEQIRQEMPLWDQRRFDVYPEL